MSARPSFRLQKNKNINNSINRIIFGQVEMAIDLCRLPYTNAEYAVHEIRKTMKRLRAVLHLIRYLTGEERFYREINLLRDISFLLTDLRRSAALVNTFNVFSEFNFFKRHPKSVNAIKEFLTSKKESEYRKLLNRQNVLEICINKLNGFKAGEPFIIMENIDGTIPEILLKGLRRTYKRGRDRLQAAISDSSVTNNHNFRKSVKYLWYQLQLLRNVWPGVLGGYVSALDKIGEKLGTEHDLAELETEIKQGNILQHEEIEKIISDLASVRKKLQIQVWPLAEKIYAETPGAFTRRIEAYWKIYFGM